MIAGVDEQTDIVIYIEGEEMPKLEEGKTLEGILVKLHKPKRQGKIRLSVNEKRCKENGAFGIGVVRKFNSEEPLFEYEVFMNKYWYERLLENGRTGTRHSLRDGSKIDLYDISNCPEMDRDGAENLKWYVENREQLHPSFG